MTGYALSMPSPRSSRQVHAITERLYLHPGQLAVAETDCTLTTILGSCVAVCLHDPVRKMGGLNHFLLPTAPAREASTRYGDIATRRLLDEMRRRGAPAAELTATVVGGACVLDAYRQRKAELGTSNVDVALAVLTDAGVRIERQETGGSRGRRVAFQATHGTIEIRTL